jgi:hypothetical protein
MTTPATHRQGDPFETPERRPLYLDPRLDSEVLLDGPALSVRVPGEAERLVPLTRISRIVANKRVQFATDSLLACAERGITLTFVGGDGRVQARLLGKPGERQELPQRFIDLLARPDGTLLYQEWKRNRMLDAYLRVSNRLGRPTRVHGVLEISHWLQEQSIRWCGKQTARDTRAGFVELGQAWMTAHLQELGFGAPLEIAYQNEVDLHADLSALLSIGLESIRLGWLKRRAYWAKKRLQYPRPVERKDLIMLLERKRSRVYAEGWSITRNLHQWLVELDQVEFDA